MKIKLTAIFALLALQACTVFDGEWFPKQADLDVEMTGDLFSQPEPEPLEKEQETKLQTEVEVVADNNQTSQNNQRQTNQKMPTLVQAKASKQQQIQQNVTNNYYVFQALNHQFIKSNQTKIKYQELETTLSHFVMDLIANMSSESFQSPLVVRPLKLKVWPVANATAGKEMITSMIAKQMKEYGFVVFDGRKPKGKFSGEELLLETAIHKHGEQFILSGTLKLLSSNKIAGTHQAFITDYFFRNIKDGVEVFERQSKFSTGGWN